MKYLILFVLAVALMGWPVEACGRARIRSRVAPELEAVGECSLPMPTM